MISGKVVTKANTAPNETACCVEGIEIARPQKMQVTPPQNGRVCLWRAGRDLILRPANAGFTCKFPFLLSNIKWYSFDF
jgi:hypothetical protein